MSDRRYRRDDRERYRARERSPLRDGKYRERSEKPKVLKVNVKPSGLLAKESNNVGGKRMKYAAPADEITPQRSDARQFYLYLYEGDSETPSKIPLVGFKSFFTVGSEKNTVDIVVAGDRVSRQHAALQFRKVNQEVKPYIIDLQSRKGTYLNDEKIPSSRFVELKNQDSLRFGDVDSEKEFLLIIDDS